MTLEEATRRLREAGDDVHEKERLPNETGWKLRVLSPQIVSVCDTGKTQVQGKPRNGPPRPAERRIFEGMRHSVPPGSMRQVCPE